MVLFLVGISVAPASAQEVERRLGEPVDTWSEPNPGVRYLRRTHDDPPISIYALEVDLHRARIVATSEEERWGSVSSFAREREAAAAINGGFWGMWQRPCGITAGGGEVWESSEPDPEFGHFAVRSDGRASVYAPGDGEDERSLARVTDAVSGRPVLLTRGRVATEILDAFETSNLRQPRTAVGVSRDGRTAYLVVVDGRQDHSVGLTLYQLARLLAELGAWRAINLDGGGSSTMFVREAGGVVSSPARGRWVRRLGLDEPDVRRVRTRHGVREVYERGVEREVMNHLAVIADPPERAVEVTRGDILLDGLPEMGPRVASFAPTEGERPLRLGKAREWLYPAAFVGASLLLIGLAFAGLGRIARRLSSARAARRARRGAARTALRSSRT